MFEGNECETLRSNTEPREPATELRLAVSKKAIEIKQRGGSTEGSQLLRED